MLKKYISGLFNGNTFSGCKMFIIQNIQKKSTLTLKQESHYLPNQ